MNTPGFSLQAKILLCAACNIAVLALALLAFSGMQFRNGVESILLAPGHARLRALGEEVSLAIERRDPSDWNSLLGEQEKRHGVRLGLFFNDGRNLAGGITALPIDVSKRLQGPPPGSRPPGPPGFPPPPPPGAMRRGPPPGSERSRIHPVFLVSGGDAPGYWFGVRIGAPDGGFGMLRPATLIVQTDSIVFTSLVFDVWPWMTGLAAACILTLLCWIPLIRGITTSIRTIMAGAERIASGKFDQPILTSRHDELGILGDSLNLMGSQLKGFVQGQKRFLGDVAHELSAPVARTQFAIGILEERVSGPNARYVETLREEIQQMATLVNELLHFSKAGMQSGTNTLTIVPVAPLLAEVVHREARDLAIGVDVADSLAVLGQREPLTRAVSNVLRNAVRYASASGPIRVSAREEGGRVLISVMDEGPGIPEDATEHIFTPFYRVDSARTRESGGVGLGLAIAKTCAESCNGTVLCRNRTPTGLEVVFSLSKA